MNKTPSETAGLRPAAHAPTKKGVFFFEKKNQKTFAPSLTRPSSGWAAYAN
jgi:hypothetical protein